jgi:hypothetical protein
VQHEVGLHFFCQAKQPLQRRLMVDEAVVAP